MLQDSNLNGSSKNKHLDSFVDDLILPHETCQHLCILRNMKFTFSHLMVIRRMRLVTAGQQTHLHNGMPFTKNYRVLYLKR